MCSSSFERDTPSARSCVIPRRDTRLSLSLSLSRSRAPPLFLGLRARRSESVPADDSARGREVERSPPGLDRERHTRHLLVRQFRACVCTTVNSRSCVRRERRRVFSHPSIPWYARGERDGSLASLLAARTSLRLFVRSRQSPTAARSATRGGRQRRQSRTSETLMILPQVHLRKPCYDFYFL